MQRPAPFIIQFPASWLQQHKHLAALSHNLTEAYAKSAKVEDATLQMVGSALWDALQLSDTLDTRKQAAGQQALPIIIESTDAAVLSLPWESLYHPHYRFLGREAGFTLSRRKPIANTKLPEVTSEPLKVLLFTSLPDDLRETARLDVEAEQVAIQQALMDYERNGEVVLEMPEDGRLETFRSALQNFQPHLVYLSGHGDFEYDLAHQQVQVSFLLEDDYGKGINISETKLAGCFQNTQVQLLILSACKSAKQHPEHPSNGLSNTLYHTGIPHVIGMRESVIDTATTQFATHLLQALGKHTPVDIALQQARTAIGQSQAGGIYRETHDPRRTVISQGQWCLPQLLSHDLGQALVDWNFIPKPRQRSEWQSKRGDVSLPERFIGRRRELRQWQNQLCSKVLNRLLITGAGGMGKTALAGKLLAALEKDYYTIFTLSLRPEHDWQNVLLDMELALAEHETLHKKYQLIQSKGLTEAKQAEYILKFLLEKCGGKLALFFDNLESVQQEQAPHALTDITLQHWLEAAQRLTQQGLKLILTSRWRLPDWVETEHFPLGRPVYGDYVALVRLYQLPLSGERLETAYRTLGGNFRALTFFANAAKGMNLAEETTFLTALSNAEAEAQINMALEKVMAQLSSLEQQLLYRLLAYKTAVPIDGVEAVCEVETTFKPSFAKNKVEKLLQQLLDVSLLEQYETAGQTTYQLATLVHSWLLARGAPAPDQTLLQAAAEFLLWQLEEHINTSWEHHVATHQALLDANLLDKSEKLALELLQIAQKNDNKNNNGQYGSIILNIGQQYLDKNNLFALNLIQESILIIKEAHDLPKKMEDSAIAHLFKGEIGNHAAIYYLKKSLAARRQLDDKQGMKITLNNMYTIARDDGDYDAAFEYLQQALAITQEIGDKASEHYTLNNMATIAYERCDYNTALNFWKRALAIAQEISDKEGEGQSLNNISQVYFARGDYDTAIDFLKRSLTITQEIDGRKGEGTTLNNIAQIHSARGDYDTALEFLEKSLAIRQETDDKEGEGTTINNMAAIYHTRGDYNTALKYLRKSLAIRQEIGDKSGEGATLNNISQIYSAQGDYDSTLDFLKKSLTIQQEIGDKFGEATTLNNMATTAYDRGNYDAAIDLLKKSLAIQQEIGDKSGEGTTLNNISQIFTARGDYNTAIDLLKKSLTIRQEIGDVAGLCSTTINIGHIYWQNGQQKEALLSWIAGYQSAQKIGYAQALNALESMAEQLGLKDGLQGWERLAQQTREKSK
jgi:tetratricopeptide (TPR) repeat protein